MRCVTTAELIEIPFGLWTQLGPTNEILDGVQIPKREGAILRTKRVRLTTCPAVYILSVDLTGTVRMPIGVCKMGCTLTLPGEYSQNELCELFSVAAHEEINTISYS